MAEMKNGGESLTSAHRIGYWLPAGPACPAKALAKAETSGEG